MKDVDLNFTINDIADLINTIDIVNDEINISDKNSFFEETEEDIIESDGDEYE